MIRLSAPCAATLAVDVTAPALHRALVACLSTEHEVHIDGTHLSWTFGEARVSDLRAVMNTALRSLIAADEVVSQPPRS